MKLDLQIQGLGRVESTLKNLAGRQIREAAAKAVNDVAFQVRRDMQTEMGRVFDRPTPYILKSVQVQQATTAKPEATIAPTYMGGKGVDPQRVLAAQEQGGPRKLKRSEVALRRAGILPDGCFTAVPKTPFPGSDDGRGNIKGSFMVQLLSYFSAFGEQGYRANMTTRRKDKLANVGKTATGFKTINGVVFFAAYGGLRSGPAQHLPAGIWAKTGVHGVDVRPVLMFIQEPQYKSRITAKGVVVSSKAQALFERRLRYRIRQAAGV